MTILMQELMAEEAQPIQLPLPPSQPPLVVPPILPLPKPSMFKRVRTLITDAFKYNMIRGAAVVKLIQAILQLSGHAPWPDDRSVSIETMIDFFVGIAVLLGVGQAHSNESG